MRLSLVILVIVGCALGCTGEGDGGRGSEGLSADDPRLVDAGLPGDGCETICASYDPSECRVVCPPEPPDASVPADPYAQ